MAKGFGELRPDMRNIQIGCLVSGRMRREMVGVKLRMTSSAVYWNSGHKIS